MQEDGEETEAAVLCDLGVTGSAGTVEAGTALSAGSAMAPDGQGGWKMMARFCQMANPTFYIYDSQPQNPSSLLTLCTPGCAGPGTCPWHCPRHTDLPQATGAASTLVTHEPPRATHHLFLAMTEPTPTPCAEDQHRGQ